MSLKHFFIQCKQCGFDVRIDFLEQERDCPRCGTYVKIASPIKDYLISTYPAKDLYPTPPC